MSHPTSFAPAAPLSACHFDTTSTDKRRSPSNLDVDWEIIHRVNSGQRGAFDLLVLKYQHRVIKVLMKFVGNTADANDLAQETFIKAYRSLAGFRGDSAFSTWLHRIAVNTAKNYLVSQKRRAGDQPLFENDLVFSHNDSPEHQLHAEEVRQTVSAAIDELTPDLKKALMLRELEGFSYERIAREMNCPTGTVRSRIFRAREQISAQLNGFVNT